MSKTTAKDKILNFIEQSSDPVSFTDIWESFDYTPGTITGALSALLESGVIEEIERDGVVMVQIPQGYITKTGIVWNVDTSGYEDGEDYTGWIKTND